MVLNKTQVKKIKEVLKKKLNQKLSKYARETTSMPFLTRLMQDPEKVASYSFIHSLSTILGQSIYEEVAKIIAEPHFEEAQTGYDVEGKISNEENIHISQILQEIKNRTRTVNKDQETKEILKCEKKEGRKIKNRADLFLRNRDEEFYIEIKTAKPNIDVFVKSKQKLLEWVALRKKKINTILAIPYNPYHPEPYNRFTMQGYLDEEKELYVGKRFWEFLGGDGTYGEVLEIFDEVGKEFKEKTQEKIREVAEERMELK